MLDIKIESLPISLNNQQKNDVINSPNKKNSCPIIITGKIIDIKATIIAIGNDIEIG
jgi:hypothetical protein